MQMLHPQNFSLSPKLFWMILLVYMVIRLSLAWLGYRGDTSPQSRARAEKYFSVETIEQGQTYQRAGFQLAVVYLLLSTGVLIFLMLGGVSERLARFSLNLAGQRVWLQVPIYLLILVAVTWLMALPFAYYHDYIIEHRFGFSNLTQSEWVVYQLKQFAVSTVILVLVASAGYALLRRFPVGWVWMVPLGALLLSIGGTYIYPRVILPLFYEVKPIENPELVQALEEVAGKVGVTLKDVKIINQSRYSSHTNAFFTGFGKFKEVYLFDTLVQDHSNDEVAGILAHELGHWKHNHVLKGLLMSQLGIVAACVLLYFYFPVVARAPFLNIGPLDNISSLPMLMLIATIVGFFGSPVTSGVSRHFERQADTFGLKYAPSPESFIRDFQQLAISNHSNLLPHRATVFWRYSHPPLVDRIEAAKKASGQE